MQIILEFDDELKGLRNFMWLLHNSDKRQDAYDGWNFTDIGPWDTHG